MSYSEDDMKRYLEGTDVGPTIDGDEFLEMMAERGFILPRPPTLMERVMHAAAAPWRGLKRIGSWIAWRIWGRYLFDHALKKQIKRMQELAGVDRDRYSPNSYNAFTRPQSVGYLAKPTAHGHSLAERVHDNVIKTKIVKEVLPKPDSDDSGLN